MFKNMDYFSAFDRLLIASHLSWINFVGDSKLPISVKCNAGLRRFSDTELYC